MAVVPTYRLRQPKINGLRAFQGRVAEVGLGRDRHNALRGEEEDFCNDVSRLAEGIRGGQVTGSLPIGDLLTPGAILLATRGHLGYDGQADHVRASVIKTTLGPPS